VEQWSTKNTKFNDMLEIILKIIVEPSQMQKDFKTYAN
jgi:hypothetical protein